MISKLDKTLALLLLALAGCGQKHTLYLRYGNQLTQSNLQEILVKNPLGPNENIKVVTLGKGETVSHHVVQIRDREVPHIHKNHDLTVFVLRGHGTLLLAETKIDLSTGDAAFIPRNTVHYFVNQSPEVAVALAVFSPVFDGQDTIPVKGP